MILIVCKQSLSLLSLYKINVLSKIVLISLLFVWLLLITSTTSVRAASSQHVPVLEYDDGQIRVLNCMLGASSRESCDAHSYHRIMWIWATPTLCVALITFIFLIIYFPSKYWCQCCGGRYQTPNMCCTDYQLPAKYSKGELFRPVFLSVACCVMCIAGCIWACTSAWRVQNSLNQIMQHFELVMQNMQSALYNILLPNFEEITHLVITALRKAITKESQLFLLQGTSNTKEEVEPVLRELIQVIENMRSLSIVQLHNFVSQYTIAIYPICVIALLTSVFGVMAGVCNWRRYTSMAVMTLLCVLSILIWLLTAHSIVSHFVITGACSEVFAFNQQRVNVLQAAMNCDQSHLQLLSTTLDDIADRYTIYITNNNNNNKQLISESVISTRPRVRSLWQTAEIGSYNNENKQKEITHSEMDKMQENSENDTGQARLQRNKAELLLFNNDFRSNYSNSDTANMKSRQTVQHHYHQLHDIVAEEKMITDAMERVSAVQRLQHVMTTVKSRLTECEAIINEFVSPLDLTCQQVVQNAYNLYQGLGLLALATTVGLFAYIYGAKRFIAFDQTYLPQYDVIVN